MIFYIVPLINSNYLHIHYLAILKKTINIEKPFNTIIIESQCFHSINHNSMHIMLNEICDLIIGNLLLFSHTFFNVSKHFFGINRLSLAGHCKLRHVSTELK